MRNKLTSLTLLAALLGFGSIPGLAGNGQEGAAFLDIPVGGGPAALGGAYTALAHDAYAATWNPAGLGFLESLQFSGQHLAYLDTLHYEYLSFGVPFPHNRCGADEYCRTSALGGSIQFLGSGDIAGLDEMANPTGDFSSHYAAYNLAYGTTLSKRLSVGVTGKIIQAKIADVSAMAYAADLGGMYAARQNLMLGATLTNLGTELKFLSEGDSLPVALRIGAAYFPARHWQISSDAVYRKSGLASVHLGGQWNPMRVLSLRAGYRTDTLEGLSPIAGVSAGLGVNLWGQELAYAWLPYGDLGTTHYISFLMKLGAAEESKRNLIQFQPVHRPGRSKNVNAIEPIDSDYEQLMQLLNEQTERVAVGNFR